MLGFDRFDTNFKVQTFLDTMRDLTSGDG